MAEEVDLETTQLLRLLRVFRARPLPLGLLLLRKIVADHCIGTLSPRAASIVYLLAELTINYGDKK